MDTMTDEQTAVPAPQNNEPPAAPEPPDATGAPGGRARWLVLALLFLGVGLVVLFGLRSVRAYRHFHDARREPIGENLERLRPWMTIPEVARNFEVPADYLYEALGVEPQTPDRRTLVDLNRRQAAGQRGYFEAKVRAAIEEFRKQQPPGGPQPASPLAPGERPPDGAPERQPRDSGAEP